MKCDRRRSILMTDRVVQGYPGVGGTPITLPGAQEIFTQYPHTLSWPTCLNRLALAVRKKWSRLLALTRASPRLKTRKGSYGFTPVCRLGDWENRGVDLWVLGFGVFYLVEGKYWDVVPSSCGRPLLASRVKGADALEVSSVPGRNRGGL